MSGRTFIKGEKIRCGTSYLSKSGTIFCLETFLIRQSHSYTATRGTLAWSRTRFFPHFLDMLHNHTHCVYAWGIGRSKKRRELMCVVFSVHIRTLPLRGRKSHLPVPLDLNVQLETKQELGKLVLSTKKTQTYLLYIFRRIIFLNFETHFPPDAYSSSSNGKK